VSEHVGRIVNFVVGIGGDIDYTTSTLVDSEGNPVDLTGADIKAQIRPAWGSTVVSATFTIVDTPDNNKVRIRLGDVDLDEGDYVWDMHVKLAEDGDGNRLDDFPIGGKVTVVPSATPSAT